MFNSNCLEESSAAIGLDSSLVCMSTHDNRWMLWTTCATNLNVKDLTESELYQNLAQNIVREINIMNREQMEEMTPKCAPKLSSKDLVKNVLKFSSRKIRKYSKEVKQMSEMVCLIFFSNLQYHHFI